MGTMGTGTPVSGACSSTSASTSSRWSGCTSKKTRFGPRLALVDPQVAQEVVLDEEQRAQQEGAEAQGEDDHQRLVGRPVEVGEALSVEVGQPPTGRSGAGRARAAERRATGRERPPRRPRRSRARKDGRPAWSTARTTTLAARATTATSAGRVAARSRRPRSRGAGRRGGRRGAPPAAAAARRRPRPTRPIPTPPRSAGHERDQATSTGRRSRSTRGRASWTTVPSAAPTRLPTRPDRHRLDEVDGEHRAGSGAQAAQDRHRLHSALDEHVDGARDAETAEEERHEGHETQKVPEAGHGVAEPPLVVLHGAQVDALRAEARAEAIGQLLRVGPRGEHQVGLVASPGAKGQQPRVLHAIAGDEHPRAQGGADPHVPREVLHRGPQSEGGLAQGELVPDLDSQDDGQGGIGDGLAGFREAGPLAGGARSRSTRRRDSRGRRRGPGRGAWRPRRGRGPWPRR